jgi:ribosome-interacting GTPase 1
MQELIQKFKKNKRKAKHALYLRARIASLHNEIVQDVLKGEYIFNKNITVCKSNIPNKARLLKKYNRRLKWLLY